MKSSTVIILLFLAIWTGGAIWAGAQVFGAIREEGTIEVRIDGHDGRINLAVPAFVAVRAARCGKWTVDRNAVVNRHDVVAWAPALRAALAELEGYDDVPLLEIEENGDAVRMHKHGGRFVLEIEDGSESVKVVMPLRSVRRILEQV